MMRSFVLRIRTDALADRRLVGRIEAVETGDGAPIRNADELLDFLFCNDDPSGTPGFDGEELVRKETRCHTHGS
jgi:hypothetical protein